MELRYDNLNICHKHQRKNYRSVALYKRSDLQVYVITRSFLVKSAFKTAEERGAERSLTKEI
jgi:hypothetical protein